jgi:hypothetical protein
LGLDPPCWLCSRSQLLGTIKGWLLGQSFFPVPSVMAVIILARSSQNYPSVAPLSQGGFGVMEVRLSASVTYSPSWISAIYFCKNSFLFYFNLILLFLLLLTCVYIISPHTHTSGQKLFCLLVLQFFEEKT